MTIYAESFIKESPARQLGALAATLGRIASSAEKPARVKAITSMLDECIQFIELTISQQSETASGELKDINAMLTLWRDSWEYAQANQPLCRLLAIQAKQWSDQLLVSSGLLDV